MQGESFAVGRGRKKEAIGFPGPQEKRKRDPLEEKEIVPEVW